MRVSVSAMLLGIRGVRDRDCDLDEVDRNLVHDSILGVRRGANNVGLVGDRVGNVRNRRDDGRSSREDRR
jgi:hypothetical protein